MVICMRLSVQPGNSLTEVWLGFILQRKPADNWVQDLGFYPTQNLVTQLSPCQAISSNVKSFLLAGLSHFTVANSSFVGRSQTCWRNGTGIVIATMVKVSGVHANSSFVGGSQIHQSHKSDLLAEQEIFSDSIADAIVTSIQRTPPQALCTVICHDLSFHTLFS